MRITGGLLKGRRLRVPRTGVRPATDRVREAVFSILGGHCEGARVLDLFAGSGAYGLEAWSRGAREVVWVERSGPVCRLLQQQVDTLCQGDPQRPVRCRRQSVRSFVRTASPVRYDLLFADPPYQATPDLHEFPLSPLAGLLADGGIFVWEQPAEGPRTDVPGLETLPPRTYGATRIALFRVPPSSREEIAEHPKGGGSSGPGRAG